jgi:hypothetical protein
MTFARSAAAALVLMIPSGCGHPERAEPAPVSSGYATAVSPAEAAPIDVTSQMALQAQTLAFDMVPSSFLEHGVLTEGQEESFTTILEAGRCYRILGVGGSSLTDLDLVLRDENGNAVAEDDATDNVPVLGREAVICPRWTGPFSVTVRAYRGYGPYGIQVFRSP